MREKNVREKNVREKRVRASTLQRKEDILKIATDLFYKNGYDNTSTRELAEAAGLSVAGLYYFFHDKEAVLYTILLQSIIDLNGVVTSLLNKGDELESSIRGMITRLCEHSVDHKMELIILNREEGRLNAEQRAEIRRYRREAYDALKNELLGLRNKDLDSDEANAIAFNIFAMTTWFSRWYNPNGAKTIQELAKDMADLLFYGILNNREGK